MTTEKKQVPLYATPEGRLINSSLAVRDRFDDKGQPEYKVELAFDPSDELDALEDAIVAAAVEVWGAGASDDYFNNLIVSPLLVGDNLAAEREAKGKKSDAYKGKTVIRPHSQYNRNGDDAEGGAKVVGPDAKDVPASMISEVVYNGSFGIAAVTFKPQIVSGTKYVTAYLAAYQKTRDGDRLRGERDFSGLFKAQGAAAPVAAEGETRRRRR